MLHDDIKRYYALCTISRGPNGHVAGARVKALLTKTQSEVFLETRGNAIVAVETIIGAHSAPIGRIGPVVCI